MSNDELYECPYCPATRRNKQDMKSHKRTHDTDLQEWIN